MSDIYRRYFKVESGELFDAVKAALLVNDKAREEYGAIIEELGANSSYYVREGKLVALTFDSEPDRYLYKKVDKGWMPKRNSKAAKAIAMRLDAVETVNIQSLLESVGLSSHPTIFLGGRCAWPSITVLEYEPLPTVLVSVPWYDEDPKVLEQYKKDRKKGTCYCGNYDSVLWEHPAYFQEIKSWEFDKAIDEWNEMVRGKKANKEKAEA